MMVRPVTLPVWASIMGAMQGVGTMPFWRRAAQQMVPNIRVFGDVLPVLQ